MHEKEAPAWFLKYSVYAFCYSKITFLACLYCTSNILLLKLVSPLVTGNTFTKQSATHNPLTSPHWLKQTIKHSVGVDYKILSAYNFKDGY